MNQIIVFLFILLALNGLLVWKFLWKIHKKVEKITKTFNINVMIENDDGNRIWKQIALLQSQIKQLKVKSKK